MIKNITNYNENSVREMIKVISKPMYIYYASISCVAAILAVILSIVNFWSMGIFIIPAALVVIAMSVYEMIRTPKKTEKSMMNRIKSKHHADNYDVTYTITEKSMIGDTEVSHTDYKNSDIQTIVETDNLFVLFYVGKVYGIVSKDGFEEGGIDEFRRLFSSKLRRK